MTFGNTFPKLVNQIGIEFIKLPLSRFLNDNYKNIDPIFLNS